MESDVVGDVDAGTPLVPTSRSPDDEPGKAKPSINLYRVKAVPELPRVPTPLEGMIRT